MKDFMETRSWEFANIPGEGASLLSAPKLLVDDVLEE